MSDHDHPSLVETPRPVSANALWAALSRPQLWLFTTFVLLLLPLVAALPWLSWFREAIGNRFEPGSLLRDLDETFLQDTSGERGVLARSSGSLLAGLSLTAMLLGAFTAGGWLQVFLERTEGKSLQRFLFGGGRYFFRFLRVLLLSLLLLHLAGWVIYGLPWQWGVERLLFGVKDGDLEVLKSELTVVRLSWIQDAIYTALVALVLVWGRYTRSRLALHDTSSAVWAGLCSIALIVVYPIRTLRPMIVLSLAELALIWLAVIVTRWMEGWLDGSAGFAVAVLFGVTLAVSLWGAIVRGAKYHAALQISAKLVRPLARPDPWREAVGGPGGPRYPIGGDEYGVSL